MRCLIVLGASMLLGACGSMYNTGFQSDLRKRASFDLRCPDNYLQLYVLSQRSDGLVTSYGVDGCGQRASYVLTATGAWAMNSRGAPQQPPPGYQQPPPGYQQPPPGY